MKRILLVTSGFFHPSWRARRLLRKVLGELDGYSFDAVNSMEALPQDMEGYAALVIFIHHKEISAGALERFDTYVNDGGGVLAIHSATASFKAQLPYFEIIGGRFIGHGPVEEFEIRPLAESTVFQDIPAFTVNDELYLHELQPGITPHFVTTYEGQEVPMVWTYQYGEGRVCFAGPGHLASTFQNAHFRSVLQQGLTWVSR